MWAVVSLRRWRMAFEWNVSLSLPLNIGPWKLLEVNRHYLKAFPFWALRFSPHSLARPTCRVGRAVDFVCSVWMFHSIALMAEENTSTQSMERMSFAFFHFISIICSYISLRVSNERSNKMLSYEVQTELVFSFVRRRWDGTRSTDVNSDDVFRESMPSEKFNH